MTIEVYHAIDMRDSYFREGKEAALAFADKSKFVHVANVTTDDLDEAYQYTNHIHSNWMEGSMVQVFGEPKHRSTSVGDVLVHKGKVYLVAPCGFTCLTDEV